jgi:hypothetical protein
VSFPTHINVSLPADESGYIGRECPIDGCEGYFKVKPGTGLTGDIPCYCPYCGYSASPKEFFTKDQIEYAKSVAFREVVHAFRQELKKLEFDIKPPRGSFGIGISMKLKPGTPIPLKRYRELSLETNIGCSNCTLAYAVYGVFAFCPDCGEHNSLQILQNNLDLVRKQILLAEAQADAEFRRYLLEDALENCVSSFDGFARETCRIRACRSRDAGKCTSLSFQNLRRSSDKVYGLFGINMKQAISEADWNFAQIAFMRRHLIAHRGGVIDKQFLEETGEPSQLRGRRVVTASSDVDRLCGVILAVGTFLINHLPSV